MHGTTAGFKGMGMLISPVEEQEENLVSVKHCNKRMYRQRYS